MSAHKKEEARICERCGHHKTICTCAESGRELGASAGSALSQVWTILNGYGECTPECVIALAKHRVQREAALVAALEKIAAYPVHSEPIGGALEMQDIAHKALHTPNGDLSHADTTLKQKETSNGK